MKQVRPVQWERARPWLGTVVSIKAAHQSNLEANTAIEAAFDEIATVHRHMSFHDPASDLSQLNDKAHCEVVTVHPYTHRVLQQAQIVSLRSGGCFDICRGHELVQWGFLPQRERCVSECAGDWCDVILLDESRVAFRRPLCLDLGGIAKGFAVDVAVARLRESGCISGVVNAGGDLRVFGPDEEHVALRTTRSPGEWPVLALSEGSLASSSADWNRRRRQGLFHSPHVDGIARTPTPPDRFVSVLARECVIADALTKVVIALGRSAVSVLRDFGCSAYLFSSSAGWLALE